MDIEQLKLVLEMVGTATEGATSFAFAWLAKGFVTSMVGYGLVAFVVYRLSRMAVELVTPQTTLHVMRKSDPTIDDSAKIGPMMPWEIRSLLNTHQRGCEAIKAERDGK